MKKYICQKPCNFGDRRFIIGEEIPAELIDPGRVQVLQKYGTIVTVDAPDEPPAEAPATAAEPEQADEAATEEHAEQTAAEPEQQEKPAKGNGKKGQK